MGQDVLAQEEIDALLSAAGIESAPPVRKKEPADEVSNDFFNSARDILLSLLGNDVAIEKGASGSVPADLVTQDITESSVMAVTSADKGITSSFILLFDEKKMTIITDLILMGEGNAKDAFNDDDKDAMKEAVNQIMGNLGQNLTGKYGETISFSQADISLLAPEGIPAAISEKISGDSLYRAQYLLRVENKAEISFTLILPLSIDSELKALKKALKAKEAQSTAAPAPSKYIESVNGEAIPSDKGDFKNLDLIFDLNVEIIVKLGEATMPLKDISTLKEGKIISLDKLSDAPVDVIVNNKVIARGELVVIPPYNFAIKITDVKNRMDRIKNLKFH